MKNTLIILAALTVAILQHFVTCNIQVDRKREISINCRGKYWNAKGCLRSLIDNMRKMVHLLKSDQLTAFFQLAERTTQEGNSCAHVGRQYDACCAAEGDCSLWITEGEIFNKEIQELGQQMEREAHSAIQRQRG